MSRQIAVITGTRSGLGIGTARRLLEREFEVVLAHRDVARIPDLGPHAHPRHLDVTRYETFPEFVSSVERDFGAIDVLINNAAIYLDSRRPEDLIASFETNTLGPSMLLAGVLPNMLARNYGRIVNVSSTMGQLTELGPDTTGMGTDRLAYRVSKAALNAVTRVFSYDVHGTNVLINSVCPGWTRTDMGTEEAPRSLDEGVSGIVWAATLPEGGPNGGFFQDGFPIPW